MNASSAISAVMSIVLPAALLYGSYVGLLAYTDPEDETAAQNAGKVLNARVMERGVAEIMDLMLETKQPEVIILGPSYANTDVRPDILAARMGIPKDRILLLSVPNSVGAHWYSILKHRVFGAGHRPKLIVVVSGMQSMLLATPLTDASFTNLDVHLPDEGDPVVDSKVKRSPLLVYERLKEQRGKLRNAIFTFLRIRPTQVFARSPKGPMSAHNIRLALDRVFDDSRVDMSLHHSSTPIVEADRSWRRAWSTDLLPEVEDSFVAETTQLVGDAGARIVWVRPPMSPHIPEERDDIVREGQQEQVIRTIEDNRGSFIDMRRLPMTTAMFKNEDHMNEEGSRRFSEALGAALLDMDALAPALDLEAVGALEVKRTVEGEPRELTEAEAEWAKPGEGVVVMPGTTLTFAMAKPWEAERGTFAVHAVLERMGEAVEEPPVFRVAGHSVGLRGVVPRSGLTVFGGEISPPAPAMPFKVQVQAPAEGPPLRLVGLSVGKRLGRTYLVGDQESMDGVSVGLFGLVQVEAGVMTDNTVYPTYLKPPIQPPNHDREVVPVAGNAMAGFETPTWTFLSDEALAGETSFGSRCSPLRVTDDGTLLPKANVPCLEVKREGKGRSCHTTASIFFSTLDGTDPADNGRTYRLALDPGRKCDGAAWLYPRDHFRVAWSPESLGELRKGASFLTLGAKYLNHRPAAIRVKLTVDGVVRINEDVPGKLFKTDPKVWQLDPPVPADAKQVELEVENLAHVFYLMTDATLSERPPPAFTLK